MKKPSFTILLMIVASAMLFSGCGGGGGGTGGAITPPVSSNTKASVTISASGAAGTRIGGIEVTLALPAGVTVKSTLNPPEPDAGVMVPLNEAATDSTMLGNYTPASGQNQGKVFIGVGSTAQSGFGLGAFIKVECDIAAGASPKAADFTAIDFKAVDRDTGESISGTTAGLTVDLR